VLLIIDCRSVLRLRLYDGPEGTEPQRRNHRESHQHLHGRLPEINDAPFSVTYQANLIASCMYLGSSTVVMTPTFGFEMFAAGVPKFVLLNTL
jgi:hypothetical protein